VRIGDGDGAGSSRINLDFGTSTPDIVVLRTNTPESGALVALEVVGGATGTELNVQRGIVGFCSGNDDTGVCNLTMGYVSGRASDAIVYLGRQADVESITKSGGILTINETTGQTIDAITQEPGDAGIITIDGEPTVTALTVNGGLVVVNGTGTVGTLTIGGTAVVDYSRDNRAKTITNPVERNSETSALRDPNGVIGSLVLDYNNVRPERTGDQLGINVRLTRGAVA
jgi:hypothetical protein